jgi:hypothetical protein
MQQKCTRCSEVKPYSSFHTHGTRGLKINRKSVCIDCKKKQDFYRNSAIRYICLCMYSLGQLRCNCCGDSTYEFLTIDHINNDGAEHRRKIHQGLYQWLKDNDFPSGFQVLCYNCNCSKGHYGACPHKGLTPSMVRFS